MKKVLFAMTLCGVLTSYAQLRLVKNHDGNNSSDAKPRLVINNRLVYTATEAGINYPFFTDGTTDNSSKIYDDASGLAATTTGTSFSNAVMNGEAHFLALYNSTGTGSYSRITKAGFNNTVCNAYGNLSTFTGFATSQMSSKVVLNNKIIFAPNTVASGNTTGIELYESNGSTVSLLKDINPTATMSSSPSELTLLNGVCFFVADDGTGKKLWKTDGTAAGTVPYIDLNTNTTIANPSGLTIYGTDLVYAANPNSNTGNELYKTDGAGHVTLIRDITPTTLSSSNPLQITVLGGLIYFTADNGINGRELWRSNGSNTGTSMFQDINMQGGGGGQPNFSSNPSNFFMVGSTVYFTADDGLHGKELWKITGGSATMVKDITVGTTSSYISEMAAYNGKLYFVASNVTDLVPYLWVTDGTSAGTTKITINPTGNCRVSDLMVFNNDLYFGANDGSGIGKELYAFHDPTLGTEVFSSSERSVLLFPNPSHDIFELQSENPIQNVAVYSLQGQLVKCFDQLQYYDVSDLPKGVYVVRIMGEEVVYRKLLKE